MVNGTRIYSPLTDEIYVYLVKADEGLDYTIADDKGEVKVIIEGFVARDLDLNPQHDQLMYCKPEWQEEKTGIKDNADAENATNIPPKKSYADLVKAVFKSAQTLIKDKISGRHVIEVQLPADKPAWKGVIAILKTINLEYSKSAIG